MRKQEYYYGNKVSSYGLENGYVDYATFAKAFNHVLANNLMSDLESKGFYFELCDFCFIDNSEEIEEIQEKIDELEELEELTEEQENELEELQEKLEELEESDGGYPEGECYQFYVVDDTRILEENNELVWYCEELDLYIWGVGHWGTSWDYVLTNIKLDEYED